MMKILHLFDLFTPYGGGTVDVLHKLMNAQSRKGHEVSIYTSDFKLDPAFLNTAKDIKIRPFHCISAIGGFYYTPDITSALKDTLKSFDIIHIHAARSFQNIPAHRYARKYGVPYIMDTHGSLPREIMGRHGLKWFSKWLFDVIWGKKILFDASMVIAENEFGAREYDSFKIGRDKIAIIPLFFPVEEYHDLPSAGGFRDRHHIKEKYIIMSLGRIHWIKGLDFLVDAFFELSKARNDVILVVAGSDDGYKSKLEKQVEKLGISNKVMFPGFLGGQDKLSALVDADVVVQPSRYEQAAWAPIEAVMCGTPIIVTKGTGSGEDVERIGAGYLVDYGDVKRMTATIQSILDNPADAGARVKAAIDYINANLTLSKKAEEYEKLYQVCMENTGHKGE